MQAVIYARLSDSHRDAESVPTQIAQAREHAGRRGWHVEHVCKDDGVSGYAEDVTRDGFAELIASIESGRTQVVIVRDIDRLTRNMPDWSRFEKACVTHGVLLSSYTGMDVDLSTPDGAYYGGMDVLRARRESAVKSDRIRDAIDRNKKKGRRTGGGVRWFGYQPVYVDPNEEDPRFRRKIREDLHDAEAPLVREAAERALRGESLRGIATDWNDRGVTRVKGGRWSGSAMRQLLVSPHIAAIVPWKGEEYDAAWPAIIDRKTHQRLVKYLNNPGRRSSEKGSGTRKHLLAGLVFCSTCGGRMIGMVPTTHAVERKTAIGKAGSRGGKGRGRSYGCRKDINHECSQRMRIDADALEQFVIGETVRLWHSPKARKAALADDDRHDQLVALADEVSVLKEDLEAAYREYRVDKIVDLETYKSIKRELDAKIATRERSHKKLNTEAGMPDLPDPSGGWESLTPNEQRALVEMLIGRIVIKPFPKGYSMRPFADKARDAQRLAEVLERRVEFG